MGVRVQESHDRWRVNYPKKWASKKNSPCILGNESGEHVNEGSVYLCLDQGNSSQFWIFYLMIFGGEIGYEQPHEAALDPTQVIHFQRASAI